MNKWILSLILGSLIPGLIAARRPPSRVEDVIVGEYRVSSPSSVGGGRYGLRDGGFVLVSSVRTGELIYWVQLYRIEYKSGLEKDVQRYYIKRLEAAGDVVVIWDEIGGRYALLLDEKRAVLLSSPEAANFSGVTGERLEIE